MNLSVIPKASFPKRGLLALLLLLLLGAGVVIFWPKSGESIGHTVAFSDGTTMTLKAVTCGTEHRYLGGGPWQKIVSMLPRKLALLFGDRRSTLTTSRASIAFWFERKGGGPRSGDPQLVLCDENGYGISGGHWLMRPGMMEGWAFESWPRRGRMFTLHIYERASRYPEAKLIGEFAIRNPKPQKYPVWTPAPLPVTARVDDLSVTLVDLMSGVGRGSNKWKPAPNPTVSQTRAGFSVERNGQPTREWEIVQAETSDATGNFVGQLWGTSRDKDLEYAQLQPHPWPAEAAWKLRVGFSQRVNFAPDELWTLRGIPLGAPDPTNGVVAQTNLQGVLLEFTGQAGRRGLGPGDCFNFRLTPGRKDLRMSVARAVDNLGKDAKLGGSHESQQEWAFALQAGTNATSIDLTVALHRTRYVEFLAKPQIILTNATER